jgi:hypothetical protein
MSALGHKQTLEQASEMSALPPNADMLSVSIDVRKVPKRTLVPGLIRSSLWEEIRIPA